VQKKPGDAEFRGPGGWNCHKGQLIAQYLRADPEMPPLMPRTPGTARVAVGSWLG
jgi:hypothetical protein